MRDVLPGRLVLVDDLRGRATKAVLWSGVQAWGRRIGSTVVFVVLARLLLPDDFGLAALALAVIMLLSVLQDSGMIRALVQYKDVDEADLHTGFWLGLGLSLVLVALVVSAASPLASLLNEPRLTPLLQVASLSLLATSTSIVPTALMIRDLDFRSLALRSVGATVGSGAIAVTLALAGAGVWALIIQTVTFSVFKAALVWLRTPYRPRMMAEKDRVRPLLALSVQFTAADLLIATDKRTDDLLIGGLIGSVPLGFYSVAYRLLDVLSALFTNVVANVSRPLFARVQADPERLRAGLATALRQTAVIGFPAFLGLAAIAEEITLVLFGAQWEPSIPVMRILAVVGVVGVLASVLTGAIAGVGRIAWHLRLRVVFTVGNIAVILITILLGGGIFGVAVAIAAWHLLFLPAYFVVLHRALPYPVGTVLGSFVGPLVSSLIMALAISASRWALDWGPTISSLAGGVTIGAVVYVTALFILDRRSFRQAVDLGRSALARDRAG